MKSLISYTTILIIALLCGLSPLSAQYTLAVNGAFTFGSNTRSLELGNSVVNQQGHYGYQFNLINGYHLKESNFEITSRVGFKHLVSNGDFQQTPFSTETYRLLLGLGGLYHFESKVVVGALFILENNLDFDDFIAQTSDLFRYSFQGEVYYPIWNKLDGFFHYSIALTPLSDHYLVTNPQHQMALGLKYNVL